jgi:hypothetical protein
MRVRHPARQAGETQDCTFIITVRFQSHLRGRGRGEQPVPHHATAILTLTESSCRTERLPRERPAGVSLVCAPAFVTGNTPATAQHGRRKTESRTQGKEQDVLSARGRAACCITNAKMAGETDTLDETDSVGNGRAKTSESNDVSPCGKSEMTKQLTRRRRCRSKCPPSPGAIPNISEDLMNDHLVMQAWAAIQPRWPELFSLLDRVDLRLSPRRCAEELGLPSADELERELHRKGLVRFRPLRDWWYVVRLHDDAARRGSLASVAAERGDQRSVLTRFTRRVTGREWRRLAAASPTEIRIDALCAWRSCGIIGAAFAIVETQVD